MDSEVSHSADIDAGFGYAMSARHHDPLAPGTPVLVWPGSREWSPLVTRTRGEVWSLGDGTRVVAVEGYPGGIALTHVDLLPAPRCDNPPGQGDAMFYDLEDDDLMEILEDLK